MPEAEYLNNKTNTMFVDTTRRYRITSMLSIRCVILISASLHWRCIIHVIEDEEHFVIVCTNNLDMRETMFNKIATKEPSFANLSNREKFIYLMSCNDRQILTWFGKFLYNSFQTRNLRTILRS